MGVQEVRCNKGGPVRAEDLVFSVEKETKSSIRNRTFCTPQNSIRGKKVEFLSYRMSYMVLRGRWCNIILLNVHAQSEEKSNDSKDSFY